MHLLICTKNAKKGTMFENLYDLIVSRENILLAYRTIKSNTGEPIGEAKFYKHSYGFRPLRSTHHAML